MNSPSDPKQTSSFNSPSGWVIILFEPVNLSLSIQSNTLVKFLGLSAIVALQLQSLTVQLQSSNMNHGKGGRVNRVFFYYFLRFFKIWGTLQTLLKVEANPLSVDLGYLDLKSNFVLQRFTKVHHKVDFLDFLGN